MPPEDHDESAPAIIDVAHHETIYINYDATRKPVEERRKLRKRIEERVNREKSFIYG